MAPAGVASCLPCCRQSLSSRAGAHPCSRLLSVLLVIRPHVQMELLRHAIEQKNLELQRMPKPGGAPPSTAPGGRSSTPPTAAVPPAASSTRAAADTGAGTPTRLARSLSSTHPGAASGSGVAAQMHPGRPAPIRQQQQQQQQQQQEVRPAQQREAAAAADAFLLSLQPQPPAHSLGPARQQEQPLGSEQLPHPISVPVLTAAGMLGMRPVLVLDPLQQMFVQPQQAGQLQPHAGPTQHGAPPPKPPQQLHQEQLAQLQGVHQAQQLRSLLPAQPQQPQPQQLATTGQQSQADQEQPQVAGNSEAHQSVAPKDSVAAEGPVEGSAPASSSAAADLASARAAAAAAAAKARAAKRPVNRAADRTVPDNARDPASPFPRPGSSQGDGSGAASAEQHNDQPEQLSEQVAQQHQRQEQQQQQQLGREESGLGSRTAVRGRGPLPPSLLQALLPAKRQRAPPKDEQQAVPPLDAVAELAAIQVCQEC